MNELDIVLFKKSKIIEIGSVEKKYMPLQSWRFFGKSENPGTPSSFEGISITSIKEMSSPQNQKIHFFVRQSAPITLKLSQSIELMSRASGYNMRSIRAL